MLSPSTLVDGLTPFGGRVYLVEAGGDREVFDRATPAVEHAIAGFST